ncbi:putative ribonuclease H-like domain-containing protein, partial [Tanacetum coccineum]
MPLKPDLSFSSLEEFVNEPIVGEPTVRKPVVEFSEVKNSADKSKVVRKNNIAPIIEKLIEDMLPLEETPKEGKSQAENIVLFNDTECIVLSPNFKLTDESHVLLKVPRKDNMYSVDLKNIVPKGGNQSNGNAGTKVFDDTGKARMETVLGKDYILLPLWTDNPPFFQSSKSPSNDGSKLSSDDEKKVDKDPRKDNESNDQEKEDNVNIEDGDVGAEADLNNLTACMLTLGNVVFLSDASFKDFVAYTCGCQECFLYGKIEEEVLLSTTRFEDSRFSDRTDKGDILLVQVYVDDIIFRSTKKSLCTEFEKMMHKKFQMSSMGELTFFLGLQVKQKEDGIFISQDKYVTKILKKFGFTDVKTASTSMETQKPLLKDEDGEEMDVYLYRSMIGSLMYLTSSRPNIMFVVCACARYQVNPKVTHLHAVKRIFRDLKGQPKLGLWYLKDYAGASLDRKSTTRCCQFLRCRLISWQSKKQTVVANSTTEAEFVAASSCCGQVLWIQNQLLDYGDSNEKKLIQMIKIHTDKNVADLLTKAFD